MSAIPSIVASILMLVVTVLAVVIAPMMRGFISAKRQSNGSAKGPDSALKFQGSCGNFIRLMPAVSSLPPERRQQIGLMSCKKCLHRMAASRSWRSLAPSWLEFIARRANVRVHLVSAKAIFGAASIMLLVPAAFAGTHSDIPQMAKLYLPLLKTQQVALWPDIPTPSTLAAQVEQETGPCPGRSCWNPHAELKTSREYGFGLGQCTVTAHFSCFAEVQKQLHWTWSDRYNPDKQIAALIIKDLQCFDPLHGTASPADRLAMAFACYNGGARGLSSDRRMCSATPNCNPGKWFGNVEHTSYKARLAVPGYGQSFFQINRGYVASIMNTRRLKYVAAMGDA